ncbi:hypothetical protein [Petrachloros mirabilis]
MPQTPYSLPAGGTLNQLVISSNTVVKGSPGQVCSVSIITSGSTSGAIHDCTTSGAATSGNVTIPLVSGTFYAPFKHSKGITVIPGTGQVLSLSYE